MKYQTTKDGRKRVTVIPGDGVGPEITKATLKILSAAGAKLEIEERLAGKAAVDAGYKTGVPKETFSSIGETRVALKGPLETKIGEGVPSFNVLLRKHFELFGNIRPARELPGVETPYAGRNLDIVVVRENVEDLYAGIEYMQTPGVAETLKIITRKGCEKIARLAFEYARSTGRKKVHCATKANIMKLSEGMLKRTFESVAPEYSDIQAEHIIVDNCAHLLAKKPETFEVIVTTNMNGDILSDLTSGLVGGLGFAPSANLGKDVAIFEAVHGTAPDIAGQNKANPTSLLLSAVMLLRHIDEFEIADKIEHAVMYTLEEGNALTGDIAPKGQSPVGTSEFADAVIRNLGKKSQKLSQRAYKPLSMPNVSEEPVTVKTKSRRVVGVDVFVESDSDAEAIARKLSGAPTGMKLTMISNRGATVYPPTGGYTDCVDHWRCRFISPEGKSLSDSDTLELLKFVGTHYTWMHVEKLNEFDGAQAYSLA